MIKHLQGLEINSIYDFDNAFSINELLCKFWEKIEETINISNESIDILEWVKNTGLSNETKLILEEWYNNGKLTQIINFEKFNEMKKEFTELVNNYKTNCESNLQNSMNSVNNALSEVDGKITNLEETATTNTNKIEEVKQGYISAINTLSTSVSANYVKNESNALNTVSGNIVEAINEVNTKATPEAQNANDGYRKFHDGLIIQWGACLIQTGEYIGETTVIYPVPFGSVYNIIVSMEGTTTWMSVSVKERSTTGFKVEGKCHTGANAERYGIGAVRVNWIAIGGAQ